MSDTFIVNAPDGLRLRSLPSTSAAVLEVMPVKTLVTYDGVSNNGWKQVTHGHYVGWCAEQYLTAVPIVTTAQLWVNTAQLNMRKLPGTTQPIVTVLNYGQAVTVLPVAPVVIANMTWVYVQYGTVAGWCARQYLADKAPTPVVITSIQRGHLMGIHKIQGGVGNDQMVAMAQRLKADNHPFDLAVVVNEPSLANALVPYVRRVVYRFQAGTSPDNPIYPASNVRQFGKDWMIGRMGSYAALDPAVFIQPVNEAGWSAVDNEFWQGVLDVIEGQGRHCALFGDAVGNPGDDGGISATDKWKARAPVLTRAKANGHIVAMHIYSAAGTPERSLSSDINNYELRYRRLYAAVPESAQPPLVITEAAREFTAGKFTSADDTLEWLAKLQLLLKQDPYTVGIAAWTAGRSAPWENCSIDSALGLYEQAILSGRYP